MKQIYQLFGLLCGLAIAVAFGAPATAAPANLKLLTLNVWDVGAFAGDYTAARLPEICKTFKAAAKAPNGWDVILIQELWAGKRGDAFDDCGYKYVQDVASLEERGMPNNSLRILSRFPITAAAARAYSVNGRLAHAVLDGDIFVKKGVLGAKIQHPVAGALWVFNTHLVSLNKKFHYSEQRATQLEELAEFTRKTAGNLPHVVGGDFNIGPDLGVESGTESRRSAQDRMIWNELIPNLFPHFSSSLPQSLVCSYCAGRNLFSSLENGAQRYDHLFFSPRFQLLESGLTFDRPIRITVPLQNVKRAHKPLIKSIKVVRKIEMHGDMMVELNLDEAVLEVMPSDHYGVESTVSF